MVYRAFFPIESSIKTFTGDVSASSIWQHNKFSGRTRRLLKQNWQLFIFIKSRYIMIKVWTSNEKGDDKLIAFDNNTIYKGYPKTEQETIEIA